MRTRAIIEAVVENAKGLEDCKRLMAALERRGFRITKQPKYVPGGWTFSISARMTRSAWVRGINDAVTETKLTRHAWPTIPGLIPLLNKRWGSIEIHDKPWR